MRIKEKALLFLAEYAGSLFFRALGLTLRIRIFGKRYFHERKKGSSKRVVYALWHRHIVPLAIAFKGEGIRVMISEHRDGEMIARLVRRLGFTTERGSTTRGGVKALRALVRIKKDPDEGDIAITPDGPRGPAQKAQSGAVFLASKTGFPLVPGGVACDRAWTLNTWDRFLIPKPFSRIVIVVGNEIRVGENLDDREVGEMTALLEERFKEVERKAFDRLKLWNE
jgi:lysophospholipid acyltransferase (LPLAT)-like uncharacterized protein